MMKYSKQRELILKTVRENPVHPTADMVYSMLHQEHPNVSLGTVYRNLNLLADHLLLRKIPTPKGGDRFDGRLEEHYHMICEGCGQVFDVDLEGLKTLDQQVTAKTGFHITRHDLILRGYCHECKSKL